MQTELTTNQPPQLMATRAMVRMRRILLACVGVLCVGLAAIGVVLPGMPTTIFLILATACFMRSCPWLQRVLIENRLFGPFLKYLQPGATMPVRAKVISIAVMWMAIATSIAMLSTRDLPLLWVAGGIALAGLIGTVSIVRVGHATPAPVTA